MAAPTSSKENAPFVQKFIIHQGIFLLANAADLMTTLAFLASGVDERMVFNRQIIDNFGPVTLVAWKTAATVVPLVMLNAAFRLKTRDLAQEHAQSLILNTLKAANIGIALMAVVGSAGLVLNIHTQEVANISWNALHNWGILR